MNKINEIGDTPRGRGWLGAVQARAMNRRDRARLNAEIPRSERERESKKQDDIMKRAVDTAYKNSNTSDALTFRQMRAGANDFYRKNNYSHVPVDYEDTMWDEWNESKNIGGNRINEIGDTPKGQEALGRTAERAYQRAQRTSGADKKRYEKTFNDAYRTGGKSANKHLGGSREHFDNGRDYEHEKWEKEHNGNVAESKNMNKKIIRLTESDLHRIVKESVKRVLKESVNKQRLTEDIYVGNGGGYYGDSAIFTVRMEGGVPTSYQFSPSGWDFETESQLEAAAVCASANKAFLEQMKNSELTQLPITEVTTEDKGNALFWLTGGNAEWNHGYWAEGGADWSEAEQLLLSDADIMRLLDDAISRSRNFFELVVNLRKSEFMAYAADVIPTNDYDEDNY